MEMYEVQLKDLKNKDLLCVDMSMLVPPRGATRKLITSRYQAEIQGTRRRFDPQIRGMQAHRRVDMP